MSAVRVAKLRMPVGWQWDHNAHYHRWLLAQVPVGAERALDVGCGRGALARALSGRIPHVDAVDRSPAMIAAAMAENGSAAVNWHTADVLDPRLGLGQYDIVTVLSCLHHLPLGPALARLAARVRPGGVLAVIGLYQASTVADYAIGAVAIPANPLVGAVKAVRGRSGKHDDLDMPVMAATQTLPQIEDVARFQLPGAQLRRRLFFRYSLRWVRP